MKKLVCIIWLFGLFMTFTPALAQGEEVLHLRLRRDFGYASGNDIQGTFTITATGPEDLTQVTFYIDDQEIGQAVQAPFALRFNTDSYPLGPHTLTAVGLSASGETLRSTPVQVDFVTLEEGLRTGGRILLPMLGIVLLAVLLPVVISMATGKKLQNLPPGTPRQYGVVGGAICRRCSRPFPRHFFSPNMVFGKLERCPFCGKWQIVAAAPLTALRAAEQAEFKDAAAGAAPEVSEEDKLRRELEESRYQDL